MGRGGGGALGVLTRSLAFALVAAPVVLVATAPGAAAHGTPAPPVERSATTPVEQNASAPVEQRLSMPGDRTVVPVSPRGVSIRFPHGIYPVRDALELRSGTASVPLYRVRIADDDVRGQLRGPLPDGVYRLTARARAADNTLVVRSQTFAVGTKFDASDSMHGMAGPGRKRPAATDASTTDDGDPWLDAGRPFELFGLAVAAGGVLAVVLLLEPLRLVGRERRRYVLAAGAVLLLAGRAIQLTAQARSYSGENQASVADVLEMVLTGSGRLQISIAFELVGATLLLPAIALRRWRPAAVFGAVAGLGVLGAGHIPPGGAAFAVVHLCAAVVWIGCVVTVALWAPSLLASPMRRIVGRRLSTICGMALAVLVASGVARRMAMSDVAATYDRVLTMKIAAVAVVCSLAVLSRVNLHRTWHRAMALSVRAEIVGFAVVLFVAATLSASTGHGGVSAPIEATATSDGLRAPVRISPGRVGDNTVRVDLSGVSDPGDRAELLLVSRELPIRTPVVSLGPSGARAVEVPVVIAAPGVWDAVIRTHGPGKDPIDLRTSFVAVADSEEVH